MKFTKRVINRLSRIANRSSKRFNQWRVFKRGVETIPVFLCGSQRSGTNMLLKVLDSSPETWIYNEDDPAAFKKLRLKPHDRRRKLINKAHCPIVVFKPLADSHNLDRIMEEHPNCKVIWIYRNFYDMINSAVTRWGEGFVGVVKRVAFKDDCTHWQAERLTSERRELLREHYTSGLSSYESVALLWYLRQCYFFDYNLDNKPDKVKIFKYEDLVTESKRQFEILFDFLGLKLDPKYTSTVFSSSIRRKEPPQLKPAIKQLCEDMYKRLNDAYEAQ